MKIKRANEKIAFTFQTIVGFPGETDEDFADTVKFLKDMGPDNYITIGAYSDRPNTEASRMAEKVSLKEMSNRVNYMLKILIDNAIDYSEINHVGFLNRYQHPIDKNILTLPESEHVNWNISQFNSLYTRG